MLAIQVLTENIKKVLSNIEKAKEIAHRDDNIILVGASKTMPYELIEVIDRENLLSHLGENRAQELVDKYRDTQNIHWHFIGVLQTNKVKYIVDKVELIHSVDRIELAKEIDKQAKKHNKVMDILLQINMGREESKSGFYIEDIEDAILECRNFQNIRVVGLMAVMPKVSQEETIALYKVLGDKYKNLKEKYSLKYLSAGMTNDYELAIIYAGSNIVRVGRAIFGERSEYGKI